MSVTARRFTSGPMIVSSSSGSPIFTCLYAAINASVNSRRDSALQEQPPRGGASLSRRSHRAEHHRAQRQIEIGIVHHDQAIVAAQFENRSAQPRARRFPTRAAPPRSIR